VRAAARGGLPHDLAGVVDRVWVGVGPAQTTQIDDPPAVAVVEKAARWSSVASAQLDSYDLPDLVDRCPSVDPPISAPMSTRVQPPALTEELTSVSAAASAKVDTRRPFAACMTAPSSFHMRPPLLRKSFLIGAGFQSALDL